MPDERQDSIRQGINAPPESAEGMAAAEERRHRAAEGPQIGGAMGGTSDSDSPGDEAQAAAARYAAETGADASAPGDEPRDGDRVTEETREAGQRAQGGGTADESDIDRAAGK
jgi:hypothetical protein